MKEEWNYRHVNCNFHVISLIPGDYVFYKNILPNTTMNFCDTNVGKPNQLCAKAHLLMVIDGLSRTCDKVENVYFIRELRMERPIVDLHDNRPLADWPELKQAAIQNGTMQYHIPGAKFNETSICNRPVLVYSDEILLQGPTPDRVMIIQHQNILRMALATKH